MGKSSAKKESALNDAISAAYHRCVEENEGELDHIQIFRLARALKSIPALKDIDPLRLRYVIDHWHDTCAAAGTKTDARAAFLAAWDKVLYLEGESPLSDIYKISLRDVPVPGLEDEDEELQNVARLCRRLQASAKQGDPFFLSTRAVVAVVCNREYKPGDQVIGARWLKYLERLGYIRTVEKGSQKSRQASRFQWLKG